MNRSLAEYKGFIDGLLKWPSLSAQGRWVREWGTEISKSYVTSEDFNILMSGFTFEQRQKIAGLIEKERISAIHDVLAYLEPYKLSKENIELAVEPFGTEAHFDYIARHAGDTWPDERGTN
jgi:hypothetical protein